MNIGLKKHAVRGVVDDDRQISHLGIREVCIIQQDLQGGSCGDVLAKLRCQREALCGLGTLTLFEWISFSKLAIALRRMRENFKFIRFMLVG